MYRNSTFVEILKLLDRETVKEAIKKNASDRYSKGFGTWNQLVSMLFAQLSDIRSLRDLEIRFNSKRQNHYHLRCADVKRSTLSDANKNRSSEVFKDIAEMLIRGQGRDIKDLVSLIDSSTIRIAGRGSSWTEETEVLKV